MFDQYFIDENQNKDTFITGSQNRLVAISFSETLTLCCHTHDENGDFQWLFFRRIIVQKTEGLIYGATSTT